MKKSNKKDQLEKVLQVEKKVYQVEDDLMKRNPSAYRVLRFLINNMGGHNAVMVSYVAMEEVLGMSRTTLFRAIKWLSEERLIVILKSGSSNIYTLDPGSLKATWNDEHKHSQFSVNVIIAESEQDKGVYLPKKKINGFLKKEEVEKILTEDQMDLLD